MTTPNPMATLKAGYDASPPDTAQQRLAATWQPNADMETLAALNGTDLTSRQRIAVGSYEQAKAAAAAAGVDVAAALAAMQQGTASQ